MGTERADVREAASDRRSGSHSRGDEVRAPATPLPPLEVTVRSRGAPLACHKLVLVHGQAHGAAGFTPLKARRLEDDIEALLLSHLLHNPGARHDKCRCDGGGHFLPVYDRSHSPQVLDTSVGARADEDLVEHDCVELLAGREAHVLQRTHHRCPLVEVGHRGGVGYAAGDGEDILGRSAPRHLRNDVSGVDHHLGVVLRAGVGGEGAPVSDRLVPQLTLGRHGPALEVLEGDVIRSDHASARAGFDRHVADGHTRLHGEFGDACPLVLDHVPRAARRADHADDV
mmetsp:Transcript_1696/g.4480  ORF Transcript_1696/g.4480 Transcript_1696/m.4480 type:complete len:285 (+) Transcript_1696:937-1791(+)